jgi:hypothetical protein
VSAHRARVWFLDTSSLLSMALDKDIAAAVLNEIGNDRVVIIDIVQDELTRRAGIPETAGLAKIALSSIKPSWSVMETTQYVTLEQVQLAQEDVADGRFLTDDSQHWAESTIIAIARRLAATGLTTKILLSEDYDARRVACAVPLTRGVSIHSVLHERVQAGRMTAEAAAVLGEKLHQAGRGPSVTASDFADLTGRGLGRVAKP